MRIPRERGSDFVLALIRHLTLRLVFLCGILCAQGCSSLDAVRWGADLHAFKKLSAEIEYPLEDESVHIDLDAAPPPTSFRPEEFVYQDLSLDRAFRVALENSQVIRRLGGAIVRRPDLTRTVLDTTIQHTNPVHGVEAALAAYDAQFLTGLLLSRDRLAFNNLLLGGGTRVLNHRAGRYITQLSKTTGAGTQISVRSLVDYTRNNSPFNLFPSAYNTEIQGEVRHPLLQGGGWQFNQIAGPGAAVGVYNGILLAQIRSDVAAADFEIAVRDLLRDVERVYWELSFAHREYQARTAFRDAALAIWKLAEGRLHGGVGGPVSEAQTRKQFFLAEAQVENALIGTPASVSATTPNAVAPGVIALERRLRWLMGVPPGGRELFRPTDALCDVEVNFDWHESLAMALRRRAELRRQKWVSRRREWELLAARNFTKMRLDLVGRFRRRGFGDHLFGGDSPPFNSAAASFFSDDLNGFELGAELTTPLGNRIGHAAVRHAATLLAREQAVFRNQQLRITHELNEAMSEVFRAQALSRISSHQHTAAVDVEHLESRFVAVGEKISRDLLEAQQQRAAAEVAWRRSMVDYHLAISDVHFARGGLLEYYGVSLEDAATSKR